MLVADPQLIGNNEPWITRYDSDRNLRKSFESALTIVQPEVVIFLGDLMDLGSYASDKEFQGYLERFHDIFKIPQHVHVNYIPGDNDIGGEGFERVKKDKIKRFNENFGHSTHFEMRNVSFYNANLISSEFPEIDSKNDSSQISVIISHYQVLSSYKSTPLLNKLQPPVVIFSAHEHKSKETFSRLENHVYNFPRPLVNGKLYNMTAFKVAKLYLEVEVPTCSYRMGTMTVGYGQAAFDGNILNYSPMFFLSRYYQFVIYLIFFICLIIINICINVKMKNKNNFRYEKLSSS